MDMLLTDLLKKNTFKRMESNDDNYDVTSGKVLDQPSLLGTLRVLSDDAVFWLPFYLPNSL